MKLRKLTAADVCQVTGYSRNQLRGLLNELPPYSAQATQPRVAREFTAHDLIVLSVVSALEMEHGMRRNAIAMVIESLRTTLAGPQNVNREARLLISINPPLVSIVNMGAQVHEGVLVSLGSIFEQVDRYLGYDMPDIMAHQYDLKLGPTIIAKHEKQTAG